MEATSGDAVDGPRFETRAIHAGQEPEALYGSVNVPIYQTATYAQDEVGRPKRWDYGTGREPDARGLPGGARRARRRDARVRVRERDGGGDHASR